MGYKIVRESVAKYRGKGINRCENGTRKGCARLKLIGISFQIDSTFFLRV